MRNKWKPKPRSGLLPAPSSPWIVPWRASWVLDSTWWCALRKRKNAVAMPGRHTCTRCASEDWHRADLVFRAAWPGILISVCIMNRDRLEGGCEMLEVWHTEVVRTSNGASLSNQCVTLCPSQNVLEIRLYHSWVRIRVLDIFWPRLDGERGQGLWNPLCTNFEQIDSPSSLGKGYER